MQSVLSRIWTRVAVSISYDDNHYTTGTSIPSIYDLLEQPLQNETEDEIMHDQVGQNECKNSDKD